MKMIFFTKVSIIDGVFLWTVFPERAEVCQSTNGRHGLWPISLSIESTYITRGLWAVHYRSMKNRNKMYQVILYH